MKKYIKFTLILAIILLIFGYFLCNYLYKSKYKSYYNRVASSTSRQAVENGTQKYEISITLSTVKNHHLGSDISMQTTCNGKSIKSGDVITPEKGQKLEFTATITEKDSVPDIGTGTITLRLSSHSADTKSDTVQIRVDESGGGRYKDAYAIFNVTFTATPLIEDVKVGFWEVVFS